MSVDIRRGSVEFKPSPKLTKIYWAYSLWYFIPAAACCVLIALVNVWASIASLVSLVVIPAAFIAYWIPKFYRSVVFKLEKDHAYARFGVWWVKKKRVPYNLVSRGEVEARTSPEVVGLDVRGHVHARHWDDEA